MPTLTEFDRIVLGLSGGKDSTAALLWLIHDAGVDPTRIVAAFCDTGNEDPLTHAWIALLHRRCAPLGVRRSSARRPCRVICGRGP
jgi:tRNA(Ile)-lysidine synthase TilS/MesJ